MLWKMILFKMLLLVFMCLAYSMPTDDKENKKAVEKADKSSESKSDEKQEPVEVAQRKSYFRKYGDADSKKNTQGYRRKSDDQGEDGYKHFDSFHKKNGDRYGYEAHSSYGKSSKSGSKGGAASTKYDDKEDDHEDAESRRVYHVIRPWHGYDVASFLPHIDIEDIASKFDHKHHHHVDYYHGHDHHLEFDHYPHHKHYTHSYHDHDVEYDHPPHDKDHHHIVEDDHELHPPHHHESDHPPPNYFDHHSNDGHELDHHPGHDHDYLGHHIEHYHHDHHQNGDEYDHPPPGYEADSKPSDNGETHELHHPPPDYEDANKPGDEADNKPGDNTEPQELDHPPPGYEDANKGYLPPHGEDSHHHLPPGPDHTERKDSQIYSSGANVQTAPAVGSILNQTGVTNQDNFDGIYFGGPFNPDQHEIAKMNLNPSQITTQPIQIPLNIVPPTPILFQNNQKDNNVVSSNNQNNSTTSQVVVNERPQVTTQIIPTDLQTVIGSSQNGQQEHTAYLPSSGITNYNYKIYFGGLSNADYQKRYYDLNHWDQSLKELRNKQANVKFSGQENNAQNNAYNTNSQTDDPLRDSYGNLYQPIDLRNYLPPLLHGSISETINSSKEIVSGSSDGIFFGGQFNPDDYFGGPIGAANGAQITEGNFASLSSVHQNASKNDLDNTYIPPEQNKVNTDKLRNLQDHPVNINNAIYLDGGSDGGSQILAESTGSSSHSNAQHHNLKNVFDSIKNNYYLPPFKADQNHKDNTDSSLNGTGTETVTKDKDKGRTTSTPTTVEIIPAVEVPVNMGESVDNEVSQLEQHHY